jgi:hypothetical protein
MAEGGTFYGGDKGLLVNPPLKRRIVSARLAGLCVCGVPVIDHFGPRDEFISCEQLKRRPPASAKPVVPRLRLVHRSEK